MSQLENLKSRLSSKQSSKEYDPIEVWHYFMISYGYIPFDDFMSMDAGIKDKLIGFINEYNKKMNKVPKGKRGMKR